MMIALAVGLLLFAALLHAYYSGHESASFGNRSGIFMLSGPWLLRVSIVLLVASLAIFFVATSFVAVAVAALSYFFVLPLVTLPLLRSLRLVARQDATAVSQVHQPVFDAPEQTDLSYETTTAVPVHVLQDDNGLPNATAFAYALMKRLLAGSIVKQEWTDVSAGDLHRSVGHYPGPNHRMPVCCSVMRAEIRQGDEILTEPNSGQGASLTIRYKLPRWDSNSEPLQRYLDEQKRQAERIVNRNRVIRDGEM